MLMYTNNSDIVLQMLTESICFKLSIRSLTKSLLFWAVKSPCTDLVRRSCPEPAIRVKYWLCWLPGFLSARVYSNSLFGAWKTQIHKTFKV